MSAIRRGLALALVVALALAGGCARNRAERGAKRDAAYVARDAETLYTLAQDTLRKRQYKTAAGLFDEVERQHPYSVWARRAQLMSAFSHYAARDYTQAIQSAQRFLSLHPGNRDAPYAHYIIGMSYYEQIADVSRDQSATVSARDAFNELVRRYPTSPYAADARLKLDLISDQLAGKEMAIGRFYAAQRLWLAAIRRFRKVVEEYQTTLQVQEALYRLVEAHLAMGIPREAVRAAAVLGTNYPGSPWYQRAYDLLHRHRVVWQAPTTPGGSGDRPG